MGGVVGERSVDDPSKEVGGEVKRDVADDSDGKGDMFCEEEGAAF